MSTWSSILHPSSPVATSGSAQAASSSASKPVDQRPATNGASPTSSIPAGPSSTESYINSKPPPSSVASTPSPISLSPLAHLARDKTTTTLANIVAKPDSTSPSDSSSGPPDHVPPSVTPSGTSHVSQPSQSSSRTIPRSQPAQAGENRKSMFDLPSRPSRSNSRAASPAQPSASPASYNKMHQTSSRLLRMTEEERPFTRVSRSVSSSSSSSSDSLFFLDRNCTLLSPRESHVSSRVPLSAGSDLRAIDLPPLEHSTFEPDAMDRVAPAKSASTRDVEVPSSLPSERVADAAGASLGLTLGKDREFEGARKRKNAPAHQDVNQKLASPRREVERLTEPSLFSTRPRDSEQSPNTLRGSRSVNDLTGRKQSPVTPLPQLVVKPEDLTQRSKNSPRPLSSSPELESRSPGGFDDLASLPPAPQKQSRGWPIVASEVTSKSKDPSKSKSTRSTSEDTSRPKAPRNLSAPTVNKVACEQTDLDRSQLFHLRLFWPNWTDEDATYHRPSILPLHVRTSTATERLERGMIQVQYGSAVEALPARISPNDLGYARDQMTARSMAIRVQSAHVVVRRPEVGGDQRAWVQRTRRATISESKKDPSKSKKLERSKSGDDAGEADPEAIRKPAPRRPRRLSELGTFPFTFDEDKFRKGVHYSDELKPVRGDTPRDDWNLIDSLIISYSSLPPANPTGSISKKALALMAQEAESRHTYLSGLNLFSRRFFYDSVEFCSDVDAHSKDFKDLFSTLIVSLPLVSHRVGFKKYEHSFTSEEAINNLGSLKFSQSNRMPDPKDPSRIVTTTTTTTFSMAREMARSVCQRFMDGRFIEAADGKMVPTFNMKNGLWHLTPKGMHVLGRFCQRNGISQPHVMSLLDSPRNTMQLVHLERDLISDRLSHDKATTEVIFRRFVGQNGPNTKSTTAAADSDSVSDYHDGMTGVKMAKERKVFEKSVQNTFTGKATIDWLMDCSTTVDRREACETAVQFVYDGLMYPIVDDKAYMQAHPKETAFQPTKGAVYALTQRGMQVAGWISREKRSEDLNPTRPKTDSKSSTRDSNTNRLSVILNDAALRLLFREFLRDTHCEENLSFYLDVVEFTSSYRTGVRRSTNPKLDTIRETLAAAYGLYNAFLAPGSPCELNIDHNLRNNLASRMTRAVGDDQAMIDGLNEVARLFDEAQNSVFKLMSSDSVPKFLKDPKYAPILQEHDFESAVATTQHNNVAAKPERSVSKVSK